MSKINSILNLSPIIPVSYIKFLLKSTNQHGIHSPFVYDLVMKCFYDKKKYSSYDGLKKYRERLLQNQKTIKITDFGAGSRVFSSEERKISTMAKKVGMNPKRARLLNRLIRYLKIENVLELGTSLGISTAAMAIGNDVKITTVEGCPETAKVAQENFDAFNLNNIELKIGEFGVLLNDILEGRKKSEEKRDENRKKRKENKEIPNPPAGRAGPESPINEQQTTTDQKSQNPNSKSHPEISGPNPQLTNPESRINKHQTFDLIFFDGNHKREATLSYFEKLLPLAHNDSVFIFDDIHWSEGMEEAWKEICAHPKVKVSIDTFQWGLVFFRKEQKKQHFVIRL